VPGAPRKVDHRTGSTAAFAAAIADGLPATTANTRRGVTSFAVEGDTFLTVHLAGGEATVHTSEEDIDLDLGHAGRDDVREQIESAWADYAPNKRVAAYRAARTRRAKQKPITQDDVRRLILELPGAAEGPIWGKDLGFLIGSDKKTRFARFGPPEGGRVGNLLPPDDVDTVVVFYCPQKPDLLASAADRYFSTPHYGSADEPGGVIVRLSEFRGPTELAELAELVEDAWREVASPDLIAQLDGPGSGGAAPGHH
jgi:hypothetical protein